MFGGRLAGGQGNAELPGFFWKLLVLEVTSGIVNFENSQKSRLLYVSCFVQTFDGKRSAILIVNLGCDSARQPLVNAVTAYGKNNRFVKSRNYTFPERLQKENTFPGFWMVLTMSGYLLNHIDT